MSDATNERAGELLRRLRRVLVTRPGVRFAFLFGSTARGDSGPLSDVDIAVYHDPAIEDLRWLLADLVEASGTDRVDLVALNSAGPLLRQRVFRDGIPIVVQDHDLLGRLRFRTQIEYLDTAPLRRLWWAGFRQRWGSAKKDGP